MRIVGGKYKGRVFNPGKQFKSRPTTDLAKEALFNILENRFDLSKKKVLDLFSGSGSMAYEFISRGAKKVVMVEKNYRHFSFIKETLKKFDETNNQLFKGDTFLFLKKSTDKFDIIFADPPFDLQNLESIPGAVFEAEILNKSGLFILEHPSEFQFSKHPNFLELRKYGKVNFSFFS